MKRAVAILIPYMEAEKRERGKSTERSNAGCVVLATVKVRGKASPCVRLQCNLFSPGTRKFWDLLIFEASGYYPPS